MQLEDQVSSLAQSKKLKELGISQVALFSWCGNEDHMANGKPWVWVSQTVPVNNQQEEMRQDVPASKPFAAAFTVAELGQMLIVPKINNAPNGFSAGFDYDKWVIKKDGHVYENMSFQFEAHTRAQLLIIFLEQNIITVEQANQRLVL